MSVPYRWVIVAAGGLMGCVAIGSMFSLPVFLSPIAQATSWSRTGLSTAMTINFLALAVTGFGWGILVDRFGARLVVLSGGVLLGLGIALASRSQSLVEFQLVYGLLVGAGAGAIFAPLMATVTGWFDTQRSLAVSLVSAGMGVAPMTVAPLAARWSRSTTGVLRTVDRDPRLGCSAACRAAGPPSPCGRSEPSSGWQCVCR